MDDIFNGWCPYVKRRGHTMTAEAEVAVTYHKPKKTKDGWHPQKL